MAVIFNLVWDSIMFMDLQNLQFATKIELFVKNNQRHNQKNNCIYFDSGHFAFFDFETDPLFSQRGYGPNRIQHAPNLLYMQVFMLSSGSAHVGFLLLHIDSAKLMANHTHAPSSRDLYKYEMYKCWYSDGTTSKQADFQVTESGECANWINFRKIKSLFWEQMNSTRA